MTRKKSELRKELETHMEHLLTNDDVSLMNLNEFSVASDAEFFVSCIVSNGLEEKAIEFLKTTPNATIEMVWDFAIPLLPPIEIVDDD